MTDEHKTKFRPGNEALDYLLDGHEPMDPKLRFLTDSLPKLAEGLYRDAQEAARDLLRRNTPNPVVRAVRRFAAFESGSPSAKETALTDSIFDLELTVVFGELLKEAGDKEVASILVDALLYQATGHVARSPTWDELHELGTQNARGIHKFQLAHKEFPHIGDIEGWVFGKEFSAIVYGSPMDFVNILSGSLFSLTARVQARWHTTYMLHGTLPTKHEMETVLALRKKQVEGLREMADTLARRAPRTPPARQTGGEGQ